MENIEAFKNTLFFLQELLKDPEYAYCFTSPFPVKKYGENVGGGGRSMR